MTQRITEIPKAYDPRMVEDKWYNYWLEKGYFSPVIDYEKKPFSIIMPPPNVTGELHLGHALTATTEDIMTRWHRMKGDPTLWLPGVDHAGIATQFVVEQSLAQEGLTRHALGRDRFIERVWEWVSRYRGAISQQHMRLGVSCDWSRERFTMDEGPSKAVRTTFVHLYRKGLIYRGERIINWCPRCTTALSELEVEHEEVDGYLYYVNYRLVDEDGFITVATTRPETILGDTAVAVNPDDDRHKAMVGKRAILPAVDRIVPIISDAAVDPAFGTGAVKITPAHDPVDFEVGQEHGLGSVNILNTDGTMNDNAGPYAGLDRFRCREQLLKDLERDGLLVDIKPHIHSVGHCCRCNTPVEPWVSKQWFVKIAPLAVPAIDAVVDGRIRIVPERFTKVYLNWLENIRDWCISRQLWWGHRIPVWYCVQCDGDKILIVLGTPAATEDGREVVAGSYSELRGLGISHERIVSDIEWADILTEARPIVGMDTPVRCPTCGSTGLLQDPDVLDTWFSSALWPHSTLGWPDDTEELRYFYPTSVMETGYDILFFWVARMIMMGLENTGDIPFHTVYLHGLIRDEDGEKMSKVKGNVINPLEAVDQYGTDAVRFALSTGTSPGNDIRVSAHRLEAARNFANKLWNAARFVVGNIESEVVFTDTGRDGHPLEDRWILSRLSRLVKTVTQLMEDFQFGEAERQIHDFLWGEYCDWYIEIAKLRLNRQPSPLPLLVYVLETVLRLLHPFMPFITEEVWQAVKARTGEKLAESIMVAPYPAPDDRALDTEAEKQMELVIDIIRAIRNERAGFKVEHSRWIEALIVTNDAEPAIQSQAQAIQTLARVSPLTVVASADTKPDKARTLVLGGAEVVLPMAGMIDIDTERQRLEKEIEANEADIARLETRLKDDRFLSKAPSHVVDRDRERLQEYLSKAERLRQRLSELG
ncbi:MAG: valine--tRNA ligase [Chloroflexota bacterium]